MFELNEQRGLTKEELHLIIDNAVCTKCGKRIMKGEPVCGNFLKKILCLDCARS